MPDTPFPEAICDCYCRRCLLHDDCGGCVHLDDEAAFLAVHPIVNEADAEALAAARAERERDVVIGVPFSACSCCGSRWPTAVFDNLGRCAVCGLDHRMPARRIDGEQAP